MDNDWILAAVHHDDIGVAAWLRVSAALDGSRLPDGRGRLLPLVHETLSRTATVDPRLRELAQARLRRWSVVRSLTSMAAPVLTDFIDDGLDPIVLKGAALADVYASPALRPMVDVDVLIRPIDLPRAVGILQRHGFTSDHDVLNPAKSACLHSAAFMPAEGGGIDLHWMASPQLPPAGTARAQWRRPWYAQLGDDEFRLRARRTTFGEIEVRAPAITDLLLLVVLHGVRFGAADDTRWAVDAAMIVRHRPDDVDWDLFVEQARRRRVGRVTAAALEHLAGHVMVGDLSGRIPADVVPRLRAGRAGRRERIIDALSSRENSMEPSARRIVLDVIIRHLVLTSGESRLAIARSFPWFVSHWLGVERPRHIPGFLRRGTWRDRL
jgi:hypothetical protein